VGDGYGGGYRVPNRQRPQSNNAAERALRHGVLWQKQNHGPKSVSGCAYLGCIWSVVETCRQQGRDVWDFLTVCMAAAAKGSIMPSLLPLPNTAHAA
jgi:transposase